MRIGGYGRGGSTRARGMGSRRTPSRASAPLPPDAPQLLWRGPWQGVGAMPRVSRESVAALRRLGIVVEAVGEPRWRHGSQVGRRRLRRLVRVDLQWSPPDRWRPFLPHARKAAYTFCESTALGHVAQRRLLAPDLILVPSRFCARVFTRCIAGARHAPRVEVVPHGAHVPPEYVPPPADGPTVFLSVAAPGRRKGLDVLVRAFPRAFPAGRDAELWLVGSARYPGEHGGIRRLGVISDEQLRAAILRAHCLVLPTRGEGFCLPALEGGALGRPCIITNWSGHLDFVDDTVGYLVAVARLVPRDDGGVNVGNWAEPDADSLVDTLRAVVADRDGAAERGQRFRERVAAGWTWEHAARRLTTVLGLPVTGERRAGEMPEEDRR